MTGFEDDDDMILADMSILEFYLDRSTMLRLQNYPLVADEEATQKAALKQAQQFSHIVDRILDSLTCNFDDDLLPMDGILKKRLTFGALIGYIAFQQKGTCSGGPEGLSCCPRHRLEGLKLAKQMLEDLLQAENVAPLQNLLSNLNSLLATESPLSNEKALNDFEGNAFSTLKRAYQMMEPPIVAKLVKHQFLGATQQQQQPSTPMLETQAPQQFYTQAAMAVDEAAASLEDISQFSALPAVLPASSQPQPPIRQIPFEVYGQIMKAAEKSEDIFEEPDEHIEKCMDGYLERLRMRMDEVRKCLARTAHISREAEIKLGETSNLFSIAGLSLYWERFQRYEKVSLDLSNDLHSLYEAVSSNNQFQGDHVRLFSKYVQWVEDYQKLGIGLIASAISRKLEEIPSTPLPGKIHLHPVSAPDVPTNKDKKRLKFEDEDEEEETVTEKKVVVQEKLVEKKVIVQGEKKKSMLLPNETAKRLQWNDSVVDHEGENEPSPNPNSSSQDPAPLRLLKAPLKSAILPSSSQSTAPERPKEPLMEPVIPCTQLVPPPPTSSASTTIQKQKGRRPFSDQETRNLIEGLRRFGRKWAIILATYEFCDRSQVDLKDKARNLEKSGQIVLPQKSK